MYSTYKESCLPAGYCLAQMMVATPVLPSPDDWGWKKVEGGWEISWTTLPDASPNTLPDNTKNTSGYLTCFLLLFMLLQV